MTEQIENYTRDGAWTVNHGIYYKWAYQSYQEYFEIVNRIEKIEKALREENAQIEPERLFILIDIKTDDLQDKAYKAAESSLLFACMAIEAFLNHYGVKRLGEKFYKRNIEKIGITEKLSILCLSCHNIILNRNNPLIDKIRILFDKRNALVHPKTKEITPHNPEQFIYIHPKEETFKNDARQVIDTMEYFIDEMCKMDTEIDRNFSFEKPCESMDSRDATFITQTTK